MAKKRSTHEAGIVDLIEAIRTLQENPPSPEYAEAMARARVYAEQAYLVLMRTKVPDGEA